MKRSARLRARTASAFALCLAVLLFGHVARAYTVEYVSATLSALDDPDSVLVRAVVHLRTARGQPLSDFSLQIDGVPLSLSARRSNGQPLATATDRRANDTNIIVRLWHPGSFNEEADPIRSQFIIEFAVRTPRQRQLTTESTTLQWGLSAPERIERIELRSAGDESLEAVDCAGFECRPSGWSAVTLRMQPAHGVLQRSLTALCFAGLALVSIRTRDKTKGSPAGNGDSSNTRFALRSIRERLVRWSIATLPLALAVAFIATFGVPFNVLWLILPSAALGYLFVELRQEQ